MRSLHLLTAKKVENLKARGRYADGGGLYLQITPTGTKSWLFRYMLAGRAREMGLGPIQDVGLAKARTKAEDARRLLHERRDPLTARQQAESAGRVADARSKLFSECAKEYIEGHRRTWKNAKHVAQWESTLKTYCYPPPPAPPVWRDLPVSAIDTGMVIEVLEPLWGTKTETASRLRGRIERIMSWATTRGFRDGDNPARWTGHLDQTLPKRSKVAKVRHHPALPFDHIGGFMKELRKLEGTAPRALECIILTASRTGETIGAKWAEIDFKTKAWTVPQSRMKSGREHKIPLSGAALAVLEAMHKRAEGAFVFPGPSGTKPLSNMACLAVLERMKRQDITVHGFRSSFSDWAAERTNFPREVVEMALAHVIKNKAEAAYRRGDLFEKRRALMEAWAQHCAKTEGAAVLNIRNAKKA